MKTTPRLGQEYFIPDLGRPKLYKRCVWVGSDLDDMRMRRGIVHLSITGAIKQGGNAISYILG